MRYIVSPAGPVSATLTPGEVRCHLRERNTALNSAKGEKQSALAAHLAGIRAGASSESSAALFADSAAQRPRREAQGAFRPGRARSGEASGAGTDCGPGEPLRGIADGILPQACSINPGAETMAFGARTAAAKTDILSSEGGLRQSYHTTCMGMSTHR